MGVKESAMSSFGEYEFNTLSSAETKVIVVGPGVDIVHVHIVRQCGSGDWKRV